MNFLQRIAYRIVRNTERKRVTIQELIDKERGFAVPRLSSWSAAPPWRGKTIWVGSLKEAYDFAEESTHDIIYCTTINGARKESDS